MSNQIAQLFTADGQPLFTSGQVAGQLGISRPSLVTFLTRRAALRPAHRIGQDFFWTESEIEAVRQAKATAKPGRPATK